MRELDEKTWRQRVAEKENANAPLLIGFLALAALGVVVAGPEVLIKTALISGAAVIICAACNCCKQTPERGM
ncbi:MAG: hypothetical protein K0R98_947 [Rickettsiaceae bacterium]|jgi:hypothetical protein|nr:hypothetical protein [Rickettsiaceae bacterium]